MSKNEKNVFKEENCDNQTDDDRRMVTIFGQILHIVVNRGKKKQKKKRENHTRLNSPMHSVRIFEIVSKSTTILFKCLRRFYLLLLNVKFPFYLHAFMSIECC